MRLGWVWRTGGSVEVGLLLAERLDPSGSSWRQCVGPVLGMWLAVWTQVGWQVSDTCVLGILLRWVAEGVLGVEYRVHLVLGIVGGKTVCVGIHVFLVRVSVVLRERNARIFGWALVQFCVRGICGSCCGFCNVDL